MHFEASLSYYPFVPRFIAYPFGLQNEPMDSNLLYVCGHIWEPSAFAVAFGCG
jgi:hypothetical protein